ncbi:MAG TPA: hypothetical protein VF458_11870 [Ktedonobacteraceae bacterium]
MSQQEFEPRRQRGEGVPKDEPAGAYGVPESQEEYQEGYRNYRSGQGQGQVPWWARPQPQQWNRSRFAGVLMIAILVLVLMGALGITGAVLGSLAHLLGIIIGAIFALFIFVFVLVLLILAIIWRAIGRATGYDRRAWRNVRRVQRRSWRGPWY